MVVSKPTSNDLVKISEVLWLNKQRNLCSILTAVIIAQDIVLKRGAIQPNMRYMLWLVVELLRNTFTTRMLCRWRPLDRKNFTLVYFHQTSNLPPKTSNGTLLSLSIQVRPKQFDKFQPARSCPLICLKIFSWKTASQFKNSNEINLETVP